MLSKVTNFWPKTLEKNELLSLNAFNHTFLTIELYKSKRFKRCKKHHDNFYIGV